MQYNTILAHLNGKGDNCFILIHLHIHSHMGAKMVQDFKLKCICKGLLAADGMNVQVTGRIMWDTLMCF